jgi:hypothetical protein
VGASGGIRRLRSAKLTRAMYVITPSGDMPLRSNSRTAAQDARGSAFSTGGADDGNQVGLHSVAAGRADCQTRSLWPLGRATAAIAAFATGLSSGLIHLCPRPFSCGRTGRIMAARGLWRPLVNAGAHCWKACWGQPLKSSNLLSSAKPDLTLWGPGS